MRKMFQYAYSFNRDISGWDTLTHMDSMFDGAEFFNQDISSWNTSSVTRMQFMFSDATDFNQPLNGWDVSSVTDMSRMFFYAIAFNQPLNGWDVSDVTDMSGMFRSADSFNGDISSWDVSSVTDTSYMFAGAYTFNQLLNGWDVSSVTSMGLMFDGATSFEQNLGEWYVVPDDTIIVRADVPGVVGSISAQNGVLDGHSPTYGIGESDDKDLFEIVSGNELNMTSVGTGSAYEVNVTAAGTNVFEDGNNWRMVDVTVTGVGNTPPSIDAGPDQRVLDGSAVELSGTALDARRRLHDVLVGADRRLARGGAYRF